MAVCYENECVSCPKEIGCLGQMCPRRKVKKLYCDECQDESDKLYIFGNEELCEECLLKRFEVIE